MTGKYLMSLNVRFTTVIMQTLEDQLSQSVWWLVFGLHDWRFMFRFRVGKRYFNILQNVRTGTGTGTHSISSVTNSGCCLLGDKQPGRQTHYEANSRWIFTSCSS